MRLLATCLITTTIFFLTACALAKVDEEDGIGHWKGVRIQLVIAKLGTPDQILHEADGHVLYIYVNHSENTFTTAPSPITPVIIAPGGKAIGIPEPQPRQNVNPSQCSLLFATTSRGIVTKTSMQGSCEEIVNFTSHHP